MLKGGATTLWEHWEFSDNTYSHNHPMFGSVSQWMMQDLGGIQPDAEAVGFDKIVIRPHVPKGLDWVKSSYRSVRGKIVSNWKRAGEGVIWYEIEIPPNCTARVYLSVSSSEQILWQGKPNPRVKKLEGNRIELSLGSGKWDFRLK